VSTLYSNSSTAICIKKICREVDVCLIELGGKYKAQRATFMTGSYVVHWHYIRTYIHWILYSATTWLCLQCPPILSWI